MAGWRVTARLGSEVDKQHFDQLDRALEDARHRIEAVLRESRLDTISAFRDYTPEVRVHARVEISGKGLLRGPEAGVDVMGDGRLVAYAGAIRKRQLEADTLDEALDRIRGVLEG